MPAPSRLRVLAWDNPRATGPLRAAIDRYRDVAPGVEIELAVRPLAAFNDEPIDEAAKRADLVVFDHPMVPRAAETSALLPVDDIAAVAGATVGGSSDSYRWNGQLWGVAIDAACQVTAARTDLLEELGKQVPTTLDELLALADDHASRVLLPLYPSDIMCTLLSLSAMHARSAGEPVTWLREDAVTTLIDLVARVDRRGFGRNPPWVLDALGRSDDWLLAPFVFGYASTHRVPTDRPISWHDLPASENGARASILGGAGLGLSAASPQREESRRFAAWFADPARQRELSVEHGGQPATREIWDDSRCDRLAGGFFSATRRTMDAAFRRPAVPWWPEFQHQAGLLLADRLGSGTPSAAVHDELRQLCGRYSPMAGIPDTSEENT